MLQGGDQVCAAFRMQIRKLPGGAARGLQPGQGQTEAAFEAGGRGQIQIAVQLLQPQQGLVCACHQGRAVLNAQAAVAGQAQGRQIKGRGCNGRRRVGGRLWGRSGRGA